MDMLRNVAGTLVKNRKKGFTLIELIVVIVIIAILIAALAPAILGVIDRANISADEADARSILMAASVAALNAGTVPTEDQIRAELQGGNLYPTLSVDIYFEGLLAVSVRIDGQGRSSNSANNVVGRNMEAGATADMPGFIVGDAGNGGPPDPPDPPGPPGGP